MLVHSTTNGAFKFCTSRFANFNLPHKTQNVLCLKVELP